MLEERDIAYAEKVLKEIAVPVTLDFVSADHTANRNFERFVEEASSLSKKIRFNTIKQNDAKLPAIIVGGKVYYHAIPDNTEFAPFVDAISLACRHAPSYSETRTDLKIVVMPGCSYCPNAVRNAVRFAFSNNGVKVSIIDGNMFAEAIEKLDIKSAPTTIINDKVFVTGVIPDEELSGWVVKTADRRFSRDDIIKMINSQGADKLADMMIADARIYDDLLFLLWDDKWSLRLGAMVVLEYVYEKKPLLIKSVIQRIEESLLDSDLTKRGDTAFLIGNIGGLDSIPALVSAMAVKTEDAFVECVEEAVSAIRARQKIT
jgi:hypothetical protein